MVILRKIFCFLLVLVISSVQFLFVGQQMIAHAQETSVIPTIYCVGGSGVPPCAPFPSNAPSIANSPSISPSSSITPSTTVNPCDSTTSANNDHKRNKKNGFSQFFQKIFQLLKQLLGGKPPVTSTPAPSTAPSTSPSTAPSEAPSTAPSTVPSTNPCASTAPSTAPSTATSQAPSTSSAPSSAPSVSVSPCATGTTSVLSNHSKQHRKWRRGGRGGFLEQFFKFFFQLLQKLFQLLGGQQPPTTPQPGQPEPSVAQPEPSEGVSPSVPVNPCASPAPSTPVSTSTAPVTSTAPGVSTAVPLPSTTTSAKCTSPTQTLPMDPSNPQAGITSGNFYITNDTWNAANYTLSQTLFFCNYNNWYVTATMDNSKGDGAVKTYPNVHQDFNNAPAISSFTTITSSFGESGPKVGIYEFAYDIWLNGIAGNGSTEVMIWNDNFGQTPGGSKQGTVSFDGRTYDVWRSGSYVAFVDQTNTTSGTVNLKSFFSYMMTQGWIPSTSTLGQIDYGPELVSTNGQPATFNITNFALTAN